MPKVGQITQAPAFFVIRKAFGKLPSVAVITLSGNKLNNISTNAFEDLLQLVTLDLSSNNLSYVPPGALQGKTFSWP